MKKILLCCVISISGLYSCSLFHATYPGQKLNDRKSVPARQVVISGSPVEYRVGKSFSYIHAPDDQSLIVFHDSADQLQKKKILEWLSNNQMPQDPPVVVLTVSDINPFVLATWGEIDTLNAAEREKIKELSQYKLIKITYLYLLRYSQYKSLFEGNTGVVDTTNINLQHFEDTATNMQAVPQKPVRKSQPPKNLFKAPPQ